MQPHTTAIKLTEHERELVIQALKAGRDYYAVQFGKRARMKDNELAAFVHLIVNCNEVPEIALPFACYGLERLWWVENKRIPGIPELLARLEKLCGYRRTGGEPPRKGR